MRIGLILALLAGLIVLVAVYFHGDKRPGNARVLPPGESALGQTTDSPSAIDESDDPEYRQFLPDKELSLVDPEPDSETPPRTVAGLPAVKEAVEFPVIDPATLPFDPEVGRIDVDASGSQPATGPGVVIGPASEPSSTPDGQFFETDDGPLAGIIPTPDPTAPGPAAQFPAADPTAIPDDAVDIHASDPTGPGTPADPATAVLAPPMYTLPDEESDIPDPDPAANKD